MSWQQFVQNRLLINSIDDYDQFKRGQIMHGQGYETVVIEGLADPSLLLDAQLFANNPQATIKMEDIDGNRVTLDLRTQTVRAAYRTGRNLLAGLPATFAEYHVAAFDKSAFTAADLDAMFRWKNVQRLRISGAHDVALTLSQRIGDFEKLPHLENLAVDVTPKSYTQLSASKFLKGVRSLQVVGFYGSDISMNDFLVFAANQKPVNGWISEQLITDYDRVLWYTRV